MQTTDQTPAPMAADTAAGLEVFRSHLLLVVEAAALWMQHNMGPQALMLGPLVKRGAQAVRTDIERADCSKLARLLAFTRRTLPGVNDLALDDEQFAEVLADAIAEFSAD